MDEQQNTIHLIQPKKCKPSYRFIVDDTYDRNGKPRTTYSIYGKFEQPGDYILLYNSFKLSWAMLAYDRIKDIGDIYIYNMMKEELFYPMFEYEGQMYRTEYVFIEQSCIVGSQIPDNQRYAEFCPEAQKFEYATSHVVFHNKGECVVKGNQLFMNGNLLLNSRQLRDVCGKYKQNMSYLDSSPDGLLQYIKETYPEATEYDCNCMWQKIIRG